MKTNNKQDYDAFLNFLANELKSLTEEKTLIIEDFKKQVQKEFKAKFVPELFRMFVGHLMLTAGSATMTIAIERMHKRMLDTIVKLNYDTEQQALFLDGFEEFRTQVFKLYMDLK